MRDAFGLFRGHCLKEPSCLEYCTEGSPTGPLDTSQLRCSRCGCSPQDHAATASDDTHGEAHRERNRARIEASHDNTQAALGHKAAGDDAFRRRNFRTAYAAYGAALALTPDDPVLLSNRSLAYLRAGRVGPALADAERAAALAPGWSKAAYRRGACLQQLERCDEAAEAFERAEELEPGDCAEARRGRQAALQQAAAQRRQHAELDRSRRQTTERQMLNAAAAAEHEAKLEAVAAGRISSVQDWTDADSRAWRAQSEAAEGGGSGDTGVDDVADEASGLVLESNSETGEGGGSGGEGGGGGGTLALPPRRYTLVHEDGRIHSRDNFEPAWGMRRVHLESAPEPVWVQTDAARWLQSAEALTASASLASTLALTLTLTLALTLALAKG